MGVITYINNDINGLTILIARTGEMKDSRDVTTRYDRRKRVGTPYSRFDEHGLTHFGNPTK